MTRRAVPYSSAELAWIERNATMMIRDLHSAFCDRFDRVDVTAANLHSLRKRKGWKTGRKGHFSKGHIPHTKGKPRDPSWARPSSTFKPGSRSGRAEELYKPIGFERLHESGYRQRKVNDDLPLQARWKFVHLIEWEAVNGPMPPGHVLKCLSTDKLNTAPSNWKLVPRGVLSRLNGAGRRGRMTFEQAADELKPTVLALAEIEHAVASARKRSAHA